MEPNTDKMIQNLKAAGCGKTQIASIMAEWNNGHTTQALRLLENHRKALLNRFHKSKECIDCLDYLVFQIEQEQKIKSR